MLCQVADRIKLSVNGLMNWKILLTLNSVDKVEADSEVLWFSKIICGDISSRPPCERPDDQILTPDREASCRLVYLTFSSYLNCKHSQPVTQTSSSVSAHKHVYFTINGRFTVVP